MKPIKLVGAFFLSATLIFVATSRAESISGSVRSVQATPVSASNFADAIVEIKGSKANVIVQSSLSEGNYLGATLSISPEPPEFYRYFSTVKAGVGAFSIDWPELPEVYLHIGAAKNENDQPENVEVFRITSSGSGQRSSRTSGICDSLPLPNPSLATIEQCIQLLSAQLKIPIGLFRAKVTHESIWQPNIITGDCGIGLMQLTPFPTFVSTGCTRQTILTGDATKLRKFQASIVAGAQGDNSFTTTTAAVEEVPDVLLLLDDWRYNLEFGARYLLALKGRSATGAPNFYAELDSELLENWFYPSTWYNAGAGNVTSAAAYSLYTKPRGNANSPANFPYFERLINVAARRQTVSSAIGQILGSSLNVTYPGPSLVTNVTQTPVPVYAFQYFCAGDRIRFRGTGNGTAELLTLNGVRGTTECPSYATAALGTVSVPVTRQAFQSNGFTLSTSRNGNGSGTVTSNPSGINCGNTCSNSFTANSNVTLTASPVSGSTFASWGGDCTGSSCTVTMSQARNVTATFNTSGGGITQLQNGVVASGSVNSTVQNGDYRDYSVNIPAGISAYTVRLYGLTGDADLYTRFGVLPDLTNFDCNSTNGATNDDSCTIPNPAVGTHYIRVYGYSTGPINYSIVASWQTSGTQYLLSVQKNGTGTGTIISGPSTGSPTGINCGSGCAANFTAGTVVNLFATPDSGSTFTGWSGDCSGANCSVTMNQARNVNAIFASSQGSTVLQNGTAVSGSTNSAATNDDYRDYYFDLSTGASNLDVSLFNLTNDADLFLRRGQVPGLNQGEYDCVSSQGGTTTDACVIATPAAGRWYVRIYGYVVGPINFSLRASWTNGGTTFPLTISVNGTGSVGSNPGGIACPGTCAANFAQGANVTLTATPGSNQSFSGWSGACSGTGGCVVSMNQAQNVTATFNTTSTNYTVFANINGSQLTSGLGLTLNDTFQSFGQLGNFSLTPTIPNGQSYAVQITQQPSGLNCQFSGSASGVINGANVTVQINCAPFQNTYSVSADVTGNAFSGGLTVALNGIDSSISNLGFWTLASNLSSGQSYVVSVRSNPPGLNCLATNASGAINGSNVTVPINCAPASSPFPENFEDANLLSALDARGWRIQNNSQPNGVASWQPGPAFGLVALSGGFINVGFNSTAGTGTISNWLISPTVVHQSGQTLEFWTRTIAAQPPQIIYPDRLEIRYSVGSGYGLGTELNDVGSFNTLLATLNPQLSTANPDCSSGFVMAANGFLDGYPQAWCRVRIALPASGSTGRIGFRYFVTDGGEMGANSNAIGIDNISLQNGAVTPPEVIMRTGFE